MVEANIIEASDRHCKTYSNCAKKALSVGQHVLLTNPINLWEVGSSMDRHLDVYMTCGPNNCHRTDAESYANSPCQPIAPSSWNLLKHHSEDPKFRQSIGVILLLYREPMYHLLLTKIILVTWKIN